MGEGILNYLSEKKNLNIRAKSAGVFVMRPGPIAMNSVKALNELNIDISHYNSKSVEDIDFANIDLILVMGKAHKDLLIDKMPHMIGKIFLLNEYAFNKIEDVEDPFGGDFNRYKLVRDEIYMAINEIIRREEDENRNRK